MSAGARRLRFPPVAPVSSGRPKRPAVVASAGLLLFVASLVHCGRRQAGRALFELSGRTMGTTWSAKLSVPSGTSPAQIEGAREAVQASLDTVDATMSTWDTTSELSRLDRARTTEPIRVSPALFQVLAVAREVSERSGGAFDVTVAPLVNAWGFGPGPRREKPPPDSLLAALRRHVGWRLLELDPVAGTVRKRDPLVSADLSAVAKGYGVDRAVETLRGLGFDAFAVEVGGEVRAVGTRPGGGPWRIGLQTPEAGSASLLDEIPLRDRAAATSGDYRNFFTTGGTRYAHILDPRTGRPARNAAASVTVLAAETVRADAWATALSVLGPEEGGEIARREGIAALFVVRTDGKLHEETTPRFRAIVDSVRAFVGGERR